jgi:hypothetical protein
LQLRLPQVTHRWNWRFNIGTRRYFAKGAARYFTNREGMRDGREI